MSKSNEYWIVVTVALVIMFCTMLATMNIMERHQQAERVKRMQEIEENHKAIWIACASIIDAGSACAASYVFKNVFTNHVPSVTIGGSREN